jgi:hypothetical protein
MRADRAQGRLAPARAVAYITPMLSALAKILGPERGVSPYVFLQRWGIGLGLALAFLIGMTLFLAFSSPSRLDHIAHITADVTATTPINGDARNGLMVDLRLPTGETLSLPETEGLIAPEPGETACVELRRNRQTGQDLYRLRLAHRCTD